MNRKLILAGLVAGALALGGLATVLPNASASTPQGASGNHAVRVCAAHPKSGYSTCFAMAVATASGKVVQSDAPIAAAFTPADIQTAPRSGRPHRDPRQTD